MALKASLSTPVIALRQVAEKTKAPRMNPKQVDAIQDKTRVSPMAPHGQLVGVLVKYRNSRRSSGTHQGNMKSLTQNCCCEQSTQSCSQVIRCITFPPAESKLPWHDLKSPILGEKSDTKREELFKDQKATIPRPDSVTGPIK